MRKTLILAALFLVPLFAFGRTVEFPIEYGRMVEIDAFGNLIENHSFVWKLFNVNGWSVWSIQIAYAEELTLKEEIILYATGLADKFGIPIKKLLAIINCESGFNTLAINPKDIDGYKKYGLLQWYLPTYYGHGGKDWRNWKENLDIGVPMMVKDGLGRWPVCSGLKTYEELTR